MQEPHRPVYPCVPPVFYHRQLRPHVNELLVSDSFLSVSCLFHLFSEWRQLEFGFTSADYALKFDNRVP